MAEITKLISEEWSEEVKNFMEASSESVPVSRGSVRLSKALITAKPEAYVPQMLSLGPYHHISLKDDSVGPFHKRLTHLSQMEVHKLRSAREAARYDPELIKRMFGGVCEPAMISEFQHFYDWEIDEDDIPSFAWMMMVDALFLSYFLKSDFNDALMCDIIKLENQIPLSLLTKLDHISDRETNTLQSRLASVTRRLSSFQISANGSQLDLNEKHLLGCIHKYVSSFLQVGTEEEGQPTWRQRISNVMEDMVAAVFSRCYTHPAKRGRPDFLVKYSAKELVKAGIKFESFKEQGKIRFCKNSDTLFLPQITICDTYTEVLLRNLLALEFIKWGGEKHVSKYVELMDCLIDTPEDVVCLRDSHVIDRQSMMITDEYVAKMWDGMSKPCFLAGFLEHPGGLKAQIREVLIKNYYRSAIKTQLWELYQEYFSTPWKVFALLVAFFVLLLTVLQTYCSVHDCEIEKHPKVNPRKFFKPFG